MLRKLEALANASDRDALFESFCEGEAIKGPKVGSIHTIAAGHAMTLDDFERGLTNGWFGTTRMLGKTARDQVKILVTCCRIYGLGQASIDKLREILDPGPSPVPLMVKTVWYFYDKAKCKTPMQHAGPSLALQLALPVALKHRSSTRRDGDYIVFEIPASSLRDPRKPRFTDPGTLERLDYWRPGGQTVPRKTGLSGLDEMVAPPTVLKDAVSAVAILKCDHL